MGKVMLEATLISLADECNRSYNEINGRENFDQPNPEFQLFRRHFVAQ